MSIDKNQLQQLIIQPSINAIGLFNDDAVALLMMTCAQESQLGTYVKQVNGIALGIMQIQPETYDDIWNNYISNKAWLSSKIYSYIGYTIKPPATRLITDLSLSMIIARLIYARVNAPIPSKNDVNAMATYYKQYYNTSLGAAQIDDVISNYNKYVIY